MGKSIFSGLIEKLKEKMGKGKSPPEIPEPSEQNVAPSVASSNSKSANISDQGLTRAFAVENRPFWHKTFIIILVASITYIFGSLFAIKLVTILVPKKSAPPFTDKFTETDNVLNELSIIKRVNLFNAKDDKVKKKVIVKKKPEKEVPCETADKKSSLPLKLSDTIVLQNRVKSMAFIEVSGKPTSGFRENDSLNGMARIDRIDRLTVYIKNLKTRRCEFISNIDESFEKTFKKKNIVIIPPKPGKKLIDENLKKQIRVEGNKFFIKKSLKDNMLANIGSVLTQARAVQIKNPDGTLNFKMVEIEPGSIYSLLNLSNGDIITKIDGEPIKNLNDIMSMFGKIKNISNLSLTVKKNGEEQVKEYAFEN